jgi:predicted porin
MKQSVLSLAVLAALCVGGYAHAQTTQPQFYGIIDAGMEYVNHTTASGGNMARVISGGKNTSRWGIRGSEDLGDGMKAVYGLEGGILLDNGTADGPLFKRQAYVGLDGRYGRVVLGRSFTTVYDFVIQYDPLGFAPNYSWGTSGPATGSSKYGMTTAFDNLVKYSGHTGNLSYGATIGMGEQPDSEQAGRKYAVATAWNQGGLGVMAAYELVNGNTIAATGKHDETRAFHVATDYKTGAWRYLAGMRGYKLESGKAKTPDVRADTYWGGITYVVGAVTWTGAVYHINVKNVAAGQDADPTMVVARVMYALSKRTTLYLVGARASARNGQLVGLSRDDVAFGTSQTGVTAGIQHRF